jgi:DNA repair exonuclease SbcCD ATPase subunit
MTPAVAWAQDLLDPTSLKSSRVSNDAAPSKRARPADWVGPGYARDMAGSVTGALITLIRAYGSIAEQIGKLQDQEKDLAQKLAEALRNKEAKLEEFRQGLFCSGCNQTKSEILAKGEQFPHSGQTIIKASPEQIAAKERELQAEIDRLNKALAEVRAKLAQLTPDIDTIRSQIFDGMGLWRTATGFERRLIRQEDNFDAMDYVRERQTISKQLDAAQKEAVTAKEPSDLNRVIGDMDLWSGTLRRTEERRGGEMSRTSQAMADNETNSRRQVAQVDGVAKEVASGITAFGYAGYLNIVTVPMSPNIDPSGLPGEASGYTFRMGKYDRDGFGEIIPRVAEFIGRAKNLSVTGAGGIVANANLELTKADRTAASLKSQLAAALELQRKAQAEAELKRKQEEELRRQQEEARRQQEELNQQSGNTPSNP